MSTTDVHSKHVHTGSFYNTAPVPLAGFTGAPLGKLEETTRTPTYIADEDYSARPEKQ